MSEAQTAETDFWHVQLPTGEVRYWSLDELDQAFQRDDVDAGTFVLKQGESKWLRLGELLGLDESASAPVSPEAPAPDLHVETAPVWSLRPVVLDESSSSDIDLEFDEMAFKPKKKKLIAIGAGAAAVLVLAIAAVSSASSAAPVAAAAPPPPPVTVPAPQPVVDQTPATAPLSEDVKKSLLAADKARAARSAEKAKARAAASPPPSYRAPKSGQVFHKGGNKYDPLNSQL
jgi:hypothetical protein